MPGLPFFRISIPTARPAIVAGLSLALMETLADFGTVAIFNYDTFTTAIYKAWFGLFNLQAASQLASFLLVLVVIALTAERNLRGKAKYHEATRSSRVHRYQLTGWHRWAAVLTASTILLVAFVVPVIQLGLWAWGVLSEDMDVRYVSMLTEHPDAWRNGGCYHGDWGDDTGVSPDVRMMTW